MVKFNFSFALRVELLNNSIVPAVLLWGATAATLASRAVVAKYGTMET
jgi:hypothetical protein